MEESLENCSHCKDKTHTRAEHKALYRKEYSREYSYWSRRMKSNNSRKFTPRNPFTGEDIDKSMYTMPKQIEEFKLTLIPQ